MNYFGTLNCLLSQAEKIQCSVFWWPRLLKHYEKNSCGLWCAGSHYNLAEFVENRFLTTPKQMSAVRHLSSENKIHQYTKRVGWSRVPSESRSCSRKHLGDLSKYCDRFCNHRGVSWSHVRPDRCSRHSPRDKPLEQWTDKGDLGCHKF